MNRIRRDPHTQAEGPDPWGSVLLSFKLTAKVQRRSRVADQGDRGFRITSIGRI